MKNYKELDLTPYPRPRQNNINKTGIVEDDVQTRGTVKLYGM